MHLKLLLQYYTVYEVIFRPLSNAISVLISDDCSSLTETNSERQTMVRNQIRNTTNNTSRCLIPKLNIPDSKLLLVYKRCENM